MLSLLHRYGLVTALLIGLTSVSDAAEYTYSYQGAPYSLTGGGQFAATSDSTSGTLTINNPPWPGTCSGLGSGAGQCDITNWEATSTGTTPMSLDFSAFIEGGNPINRPKLSFNEAGNIDHWVLQLGEADSGKSDYIIVESGTAGYLIIGNGTRVDSKTGGNNSYAATGYQFQTSSVWGAPVPEPSTAILFLLGWLLLVVRQSRRAVR